MVVKTYSAEEACVKMSDVLDVYPVFSFTF